LEWLPALELAIMFDPSPIGIGLKKRLPSKSIVLHNGSENHVPHVPFNNI
jgi:hypothetical protein